MDGDSWLLYCTLLFTLLGGGYFAAAETAFASSNVIRIKSRAEKGDSRAKRVLFVLDHFDKALSTLLIGNNIMHISTASIATVLATRLWGTGAVAYSTLATTAVVFLLAEMLPKSFASDHPEKTALVLAGSLRSLMWLLTPVSFVFTRLGRFFSRLIVKEEAPSVTEDELYDIIETITEDGGMEESSGKLLYSALKFDDITVQEVLTARVAIVGIEASMTTDEILSIIKSQKYSRLPVYCETLDDIQGVLNVRRYIKAYMQRGAEVSLAALMDAPYFVPKKKRIDDLLREMSAQRVHMAVVRDDYGGTMGIVTSEDILEELVGEIWDETDEVTEGFLSIGGNRYEVSGDYDILDAFEEMGYADYPDKDEAEHKSVGAWAQEQFNLIPEEGSCFTYGRVHAAVLQVDKKQRIHKMLLTLQEEEPPEEEIHRKTNGLDK
ncbi:hemolysin family protein [Christensenellaceae bacterium OttesenSCG-928-L17]|nr:hemolysin family protein [Christensenellaceae bacterium OttesenSCG-928-L17]